MKEVNGMNEEGKNIKEKKDCCKEKNECCCSRGGICHFINNTVKRLKKIFSSINGKEKCCKNSCFKCSADSCKVGKTGKECCCNKGDRCCSSCKSCKNDNKDGKFTRKVHPEKDNVSDFTSVSEKKYNPSLSKKRSGF